MALDLLLELTREQTEGLEQEYLALFGRSNAKARCPLHESDYVDRTGLQRGLVAVVVEQAYAAAGLTLSPAARGELPDHAAFELEFLSHLCAKEANAWEHDRPEEVADVLRVQRNFLDRHLLLWLPALVRNVQVAGPAGFYRDIADVAHAYVVHDRDLIGVLEASVATTSVVAAVEA
jgi:TorA maturation chaperone TorD